MEDMVSIGLFFRNEEAHLEKAIGSICGQTFRNFKLVLLDDASTDASFEIASRFAQVDSRITLLRNDTKTGYSESYRRTFKVYGPTVKYFAWAAGHDVHEPKWLETMVDTLESNPLACVAYPLNDRIDANDAFIRNEALHFQTQRRSSLGRVYDVFRHGRGFGNMIYGLFRSQDLIRCGIFRKLLVADSVLLFELAILGEIRQVNQVLWHRRHDHFAEPSRTSVKEMAARQKKNMFQVPPKYIDLPWPLVNGVVIALNWLIGSGVRPAFRPIGALCGLLFFLKNARYL
jgi:glycosyltransferase involved in cell wall biosynthesis